MKVKKFKKGFTLVELIVVIAVIAILAAVLIPTYTNLVHKANVSADSQLVRNLNERMALYEAETGKKPETAHEAFMLTEDFGFIIEKLTPTSSGNEIVWDMKSNRFALIEKNTVKVIFSDSSKEISSNPLELWKVYKPKNQNNIDLSNSKYSVYLAGNNFTGSITANVGIDVGRNAGITSITYANNKADQDVVIRTNSVDTALTVYGPSDDVKHYGVVGDLTITAVDPDDCYYEYGFVSKLVSFGTGKFVVCESAQFHQTMDDVAAIFENNENARYVDGKAPQYAQHKWDENGVCEYDHCTGGANGGKAVSDSHTHDFVDGVCACGEEEVTAPVEVHLTGVVGYENQSDHYTDSNTLIGKYWSDDYKISYYNSGWLLQHYLTVTYTIPSDTPANATIICDPVTEWNEKIKDIAPGQALAFTYKIVNNSSHSFDIKQTDVHSDVVEAISKSNAIVKVGSDYKVLKNDGTYFDLDKLYIPFMTKCSYFNNYITWLKDSGATTQTSATSMFMGEYYNTFANSSDKSFYYYLDTEVVQKGTSWDEVLDVLCGSPSNSAGNITYNSKDAQYVECELIRLMMKFSYEKAFGFVFVQNTENGWENDAYEKILNNNKKTNFGTGFFGWDTCDPTTLKAYNFLELCEDGATLNYLKNGNTISGGIACLWHAYAGNAWQGVTLCDAPQFTIVLEAN